MSIGRENRFEQSPQSPEELIKSAVSLNELIDLIRTSDIKIGSEEDIINAEGLAKRLEKYKKVIEAIENGEHDENLKKSGIDREAGKAATLTGISRAFGLRMKVAELIGIKL